MHGFDAAALILRSIVGFTVLAHGWNHAWGGGRLPGTARWFESIGIRPGRVHALFATVVELVCGVLLIVGLLTPVAASGVLGVMLVALVANHRKNGYFIFRPGEGYEYVLVLACVAVAIGGIGPGWLSVDHAADIVVDGWGGMAVTAAAGGGGAALLLATCWRPDRTASDPGR